MKPTIRQLSTDELIQMGADGYTIWVAELNGDRIGGVALAISNGIPFATDLRASTTRPEVAAMLIQKVRKHCKELGFKACHFTVEAGSPGILPLILNGKARITHVMASIEVD